MPTGKSGGRTTRKSASGGVKSVRPSRLTPKRSTTTKTAPRKK